MTMGTIRNMDARNQMFLRSETVLPSFKNLANAKAVAHLANSVGCMLNEPILIHALAPDISEPINNTNIIRNRQNR